MSVCVNGGSLSVAEWLHHGNVSGAPLPGSRCLPCAAVFDRVEFSTSVVAVALTKLLECVQDLSLHAWLGSLPGHVSGGIRGSVKV